MLTKLFRFYLKFKQIQSFGFTPNLVEGFSDLKMIHFEMHLNISNTIHKFDLFKLVFIE